MRFPEGELMPAIVSVGIATGKRVVTNTDLDNFLGRRIGVTDALMRRGRVGIQQRFWVEKGKATSDLCVEALQRAITAAGIEAFEISALLTASSSPDRPAVPLAAIVQEKLGLSQEIFASNNNDACAGFVLAFRRACADLTSPFKLGGYYAVVGAEVMSTVIGKDNGYSHPERKKESISVLVGDAAGAVIMKMVIPDKGVPTNMGFAFGADGAFADELGIEAGGSLLPTSLKTVEEEKHCLHMNGPVIFDQAVRRMTEVARRALTDSGVPLEEIDLVKM